MRGRWPIWCRRLQKLLLVLRIRVDSDLANVTLEVDRHAVACQAEGGHTDAAWPAGRERCSMSGKPSAMSTAPTVPALHPILPAISCRCASSALCWTRPWLRCTGWRPRCWCRPSSAIASGFRGISCSSWMLRSGHL